MKTRGRSVETERPKETVAESAQLLVRENYLLAAVGILQVTEARHTRKRGSSAVGRPSSTAAR